MKIKLPNDGLVMFEDLRVGDLFEYDKLIYLKIKTTNTEFNCVCLTEDRLANFVTDLKVCKKVKGHMEISYES